MTGIRGVELDDLTYDLEEDGVLVRRELDRAVIARGGWATVLFLYQEIDRKTGRPAPPRIAVVRLRKARGVYRRQSAFTVAGAGEARRVAALLGAWSERMVEDGSEEAGESQAQGKDEEGGA